jgi:carbon-monoxide dehydrogenase medium subunit
VKPSAFEYVRPRTKAEALSLLAEEADRAKVLAGGQSLVPMMNFRLARPEMIIDINDVDGLDFIRSEADRVHIGTRTRHHTVEQIPGDAPLAQLLRAAGGHIGHLPIRTRGTFGGSLAHCDAASEWCLVASLLDAEVTAESSRGARVVKAADFFQSIFTTDLAADELLVSVALPKLSEEHQVGFAEFARRAGDFAIVAATTDVRVENGTVTEARVCVGGVAETPFRCAEAEATLVGASFDTARSTAAAVEAAAAAARGEVSPPDDMHADAKYRRDLVEAMVRRSLLAGADR